MIKLTLFQQTCVAAATAALLLITSWYELIGYWLESAEFGHGLLLSLVALTIIWRRRGHFNNPSERGSAVALVITLLGFLLHMIGIAGDIQAARFYALMIILCALPVYFLGYRGVPLTLFPCSLLLLSVPLHPSVNTALTAYLQLVSTDIGVWMIRLLGMAALQDGNVINLGSFVLLVEEACSGLRYLLPLISLHIIVANYFRGGWILKTFIILSAVPITVFTNSLRIALTGLIIKYFGSEAATGFLHDFEGLAVFAFACALTLLMLLTLCAFAFRTVNIHACFRVESIDKSDQQAAVPVTAKFLSLLAIITALGAANIYLLTVKKETIPDRTPFSQFPLVIEGRNLYPDTLDEQFIDILKPDDYFIGDYVEGNSQPINLYMAYYAVQKNGSLIHSPSQCIPAGGWEIRQQKTIDLSSLGMSGTATKAIISRDATQLLVYYWVHQQGQNFADGKDVYLSLIKRSILYSRTDGALIRLITPIEGDESGAAEERLNHFVISLSEVFPEYLPQ